MSMWSTRPSARTRATPRSPPTNIPKVVGGVTPACLRRRRRPLRGRLRAGRAGVSPARSPKLTKLLENIYRAVNIALVNELKMVADRDGHRHLGGDRRRRDQAVRLHAVLSRPGLGGHCIPIDPFYLTWKAREFGVHTRFIELAGEINRVDARVRRASARWRRSTTAARRSRAAGSCCSAWPTSRMSTTCASRPTFALMDQLQGARRRGRPTTTPTSPRSARPASMPTGRGMHRRLGAGRRSGPRLRGHLHQPQGLRPGPLAAWADLIIDTRNAMRGIDGRARW